MNDQIEQTIVSEQKNSISANRNIMLLMIGRFLSGIGTAIFNFALGLYVMDLTNSPTAFSMIISFAIIPGVFVNIFGGVFVDHNDKKKIIVTTTILSALMEIIFLSGLLLYSSKSILMIILFVIVINSLQTLMLLALNASIARLVSEKNVAKTNSLFQGLFAIINIIGPIVGAIFYKNIGMNIIISIDAVSYLFCGIIFIFLVFFKNSAEKADSANTTTIQSTNYLKSLMEVKDFLYKYRIIAFFLLVAVVFNSIMNPLVLLVIQFITYKLLSVSGLQLSIINSAYALGIVIGAVFIMTRKDTRKYIKRIFIFLVFEIFTIGLWIFKGIPIFSLMSLWVTTIIYAGLLFLYGTLNTIQNIPIISNFQLKIPENIRGRVFGVFFTSLNITTPIGMLLYGFVLKNYNWVYVILVSIFILFIFCFVFSRNKMFKLYDPENDAA